MLGENERKTIQIPITLNRASLGDADNIFAVILATKGALVAYVPRRDVMIDKQKIEGEGSEARELSAKLTVEVVEEGEDYFLVETEIDKNRPERLRVNREQGKIEPIHCKSIFYPG